MEIHTIQQLHQVFDNYRKQTEKLFAIAREQNNEDALTILRSLLFRLKQGPIRTLVMGVSSAGKSTLINALAGAIVVPEGKRTVSPIPVWIYNKEAYSTPTVRILKENDGVFQEINCGRFKFLTDYCYTAEQAGQGTGQEKYRNVVAATVNVKSDAIADAGVTLIDTPGIGVSAGDNDRVQEILKNGCEMLIIQFWNLQEEDVKQYFRDLLVEDNAPLRTLLEDNRVFLVLNSSKTVFQHGLLDTKMHIYDAFDGWEAEGRLFGMNVLDERIRACGVYDYTNYLTEPYTQEEWSHAEESMELEIKRKALLEAPRSHPMLLPADLREQIGIENLCAAIGGAVEEFCEDPDALERILRPIRENILCVKALLEKPLLDQIAQAENMDYPVPEDMKSQLAQMDTYYKELIQFQSDTQSKLDLGANYSEQQWPVLNLSSIQLPDLGTLLCDEASQADAYIQEKIPQENSPYYLTLRVSTRLKSYLQEFGRNLEDADRNPEIKYWEDYFRGITEKLFGQDPMGNLLLEPQRVHLFAADISRTFYRAKQAGQAAFSQSGVFHITDEKKQDMIAYLTKKRNKIVAGGLFVGLTKFALYINFKWDKLNPIAQNACKEAKCAYMNAYRGEFWGYVPGLYQDFRRLMQDACVGVSKRRNALAEEMEAYKTAAKEQKLAQLQEALQQLRERMKA